MIRSLLICIVLAVAAEPSVAHAEWAIARGDEGGQVGWGWAWNHPSIDKAGKQAMGACNNYGKGCEVVKSGKTGCFGVASQADEGVWNIAEGKNSQDAGVRAADICEKKTNKTCKIIASFCDTTGQ